MKALFRIGKLYIESIEPDLDLIIIDGNKAVEACLNPTEIRDLLGLLKAHIAILIDLKMCKVCKNYYKGEICEICNNKDKFTPIEY